jgi:hypothetical protein
MEKEFVPYELALRLKAIGFDEPCFAAYSEDEDVSNLFIYWNDLADMSELFISQDNCEKFNYECLAPTYSQAFRWLREKYGLYDTISKNGYMIEGELNKEFLRITKLSLKSHEEAELACLEKLIEIVESKL